MEDCWFCGFLLWLKGLDSLSRKQSTERPREEWRHAVIKFRKAVNMKISVDDRKRYNTAMDFKSKRRKVNDGSGVWLYFHIHNMHPSYGDRQ